MKIKAEKRHLIHPPQGRAAEPRWGHRSDGVRGHPPRRCVPQATGAPVIHWGLTLQCLGSISKWDHTQQPIRFNFAFFPRPGSGQPPSRFPPELSAVGPDEWVTGWG